MKKTIKVFCQYSNIDHALIKAVIRQTGGWDAFQEQALNIANHGINAGFHGFIYYSDTCKFYDTNKRLIVEMTENMADDYGQDIIMFVFGFNCLKGSEKQDIINTLFKSKRYHDTSVANALAWYAAEEVARAYADWTYEERHK